MMDKTPRDVFEDFYHKTIALQKIDSFFIRQGKADESILDALKSLAEIIRERKDGMGGSIYNGTIEQIARMFDKEGK